MGGSLLILGNAYEELLKLPDQSIDFIFTDPPYNIGDKNSANIKFKNRSDINNKIAEWDSEPLKVDFLYREFKRLLKPTGNIAVFTSQVLFGDIHIISNKLFDVTNFGVWHKTNPSTSIRKSSFLKSLELIMFSWNKGHTFNFTTQNDMHNIFAEGGITQGNERLKNEDNKTLHPTQKPLWLCQDLISKLSNEGDVVLDPFMGVGSIPLAAKNTSREFIGIEIDPLYYNYAQERLNE